jgi:fumarate hydratase, class II
VAAQRTGTSAPDPETGPEADPGASPQIADLPVGLDGTGTRHEVDSLGEVEVPANRYWGAQTQRALDNFPGGGERMPPEVHHAYGVLKQAAAEVNTRAGRLPGWKGEIIARVSGEVAAGQLDDHFPLPLWQSGSGTSTNMNANEVIANRCIQLVGGALGSKTPVHPNDDVNLAQSSNDTFASVMHIATLGLLEGLTLPALRELRESFASLAERWSDVVRVGRTHLQDATPITVGQGLSGYVASLDGAIGGLEDAGTGLLELAIGGTAVGTGVNAPSDFGTSVAAIVSRLTGRPFTTPANGFAAQSMLDPMVRVHAALRNVAVVLMKVANDLRWLASGPHAGIGEVVLPANEPGSSIMPGKVNPTQAEVLVMVCTRVLGADVAVGIAGATGHFELNTMRPLVVGTVLDSARSLGDACTSFRIRLVEGMDLNRAAIADHLGRSVMLVTALAPTIGYDHAAHIARRSTTEGLPLREVALSEGVEAELFDRLVDPLAMTRPEPPDHPDDQPT